MSTLLRGWIEVGSVWNETLEMEAPGSSVILVPGDPWREEMTWRGVVDLGGFFANGNGLFGLMFGVRNRLQVSPVAARRGIPSDASDRVRGDLARMIDDPAVHDFTWVTWDEVEAIDWDAPVDGVDIRMQQFRLGENREPVAEADPNGRDVGHPPRVARVAGDDRVREIRSGDTLFRYTRQPVSVVRRVLLEPSGGWRLVEDIVGGLKRSYPPDRIRLVVWFVD